jgi:predicted nucleotidyltransferase
MKIKFLPKHIKEFKKMGVLAIYLFGSQAQKRAGLLSDVDIGVVFEKPEKYQDNTLEPYLTLYKIFVEVLPRSYLRKRFAIKAHELDIVFLQFTPFDFQLEAIQGGEVLYESNKEKRLAYQEDVLKRHCDLVYLYDLSYQFILERI